MAKNAPKSLLTSPTIMAPQTMVLSVDDKLTEEQKKKTLMYAEWNSEKTAVAVVVRFLVGLEGEKQDGNYKYSNSGELHLPDVLVIDGVEYYINAKSNWGRSKSGQSFKAGRNRLSVTVKKSAEPAAAVKEAEIPF